MNGREGQDSHAPLSALNLPHAIHAQALKPLGAIDQARTATDCHRAADRAEGFGLGIVTPRALPPLDVENLYQVFGSAGQARQVELGG